MPPPAEGAGPDRIPLVDLRLQHQKIHDQVMAAAASVAERQQFINGPEVESFETAFADLLGARHAVGVSSGTDALLMALMALEIGPGDEVITTPFTFISTVQSICRLGARPRFVDLEPDSMLMRVREIPDVLTEKTRAILPVHLFGRLADMAALSSLSEDRGLPIIEDCAQAMGARSAAGKMAGTFGLAGTFSFFPSKNLGGWGDGGMLVTSDSSFAGRLRQIRDHGADGPGRYRIMGGNFRLDTIQAAVLNVKLAHIQEWVAARRKAAANYDRLLVDANLTAGPDETRHSGHRIHLPARGPQGEHSFNLYVIRAENRDELKEHLDRAGISTAVYYPTPLHLQPCFSGLGHQAGDFPVAEEAAGSVLALPLFPEISESQQIRVVESISSFYRQHS